MKASKEALLWFLVLIICFWAGYLKGILPFSLKQGFLSRGTVRIYNSAPFDFDQDFIAALEDELDQKVEIRKIATWDDLQAKLVTKTGAYLIFGPAHWAPDLAREGLIVGLSYIQPQIEKFISPDFISVQKVRPEILPLYWIKTSFITAADSPMGPSLQQAMSHKNLDEIHLYPDLDLAGRHLKKWAPKIKNIEAYNFKTNPEAIKNTAIWELPQSAPIPANAKVLATSEDQALLIYGMMIPKNSPNRRVSYRVMEKIMTPSLQKIFLTRLRIGTTLKDSFENSLGTYKEQYSSELRDMKLHELILLDKKNSRETQDVKLNYNIIF